MCQQRKALVNSLLIQARLVCRNWVGKAILLDSTSWAVPDWRIGSNRRHDQPLQNHSKIWMACSSCEKRGMKTFERQCIYCRSTFKIVTNLICNPQFFAHNLRNSRSVGIPLFFLWSPFETVSYIFLDKHYSMFWFEM